MSRRYFVVIESPLTFQDATSSAQEARYRDYAERNDLELRYHENGIMVFAQPDLPVHPVRRGVVLGHLHARGPVKTRASESVTAAVNISAESPEALAAAFWGDYVAVQRCEDERLATIYRSPFSRLGCLSAQSGSSHILGSDMPTLEGAGFPRPRIEVAALARRLAFPGLPRRETSLEGVSNLPGGQSLVIGPHGKSWTEIWTPWNSAGRSGWYETEEEARDSIRSAIYQAMRAVRGNTRSNLLMLSGGIDSSILAASLSSLGGEFSCVNLVWQHSTADERLYARAVAERLGCRLTEIELQLEDINIGLSHSAALPEPGMRVFMQGTNAALARAVALTGADLTLDGGGGDNMFLAATSVAPVTAALKAGGLGPAIATARTIAAIADASLLDVLRRAVRRALRRSASVRWPAEQTFLTPQVRCRLPPRSSHAWLEAPPGADHGAALHVALHSAAQAWAEECDLVSPVDHAAPIATQPVAEACLRVPSWWWFRGTRSRVLVREAFAERLPAKVMMRQSKGTTDSFVSAIYAMHRMDVRHMLMDGHLQRMGLLDREAVESATQAAGPVKGTEYDRLLQLAQVEAWLEARH